MVICHKVLRATNLQETVVEEVVCIHCWLLVRYEQGWQRVEVVVWSTVIAHREHLGIGYSEPLAAVAALEAVIC